MSRVSDRAVFLILVVACAVVGTSAFAADLTTPAKATQAFAAAMRADDLAAIRAATTGGTDADYVTLRSWAAFARSARGLRTAMDGKFGAGTGAGIRSGGLGQFEDPSQLAVKIDGDTATVSTLGEHPRSLTLTRRDASWRVDIARLPDKDQLSSGAAEMRAIGKIMDRIAREVADSQYATPQDATGALTHAMQPVLQPDENGSALAQEARSTRSAVAFPPKSPVAGYDPKKVDAQRAQYEWSGIPMAVELVLKLTGREPAEYYDLQGQWKDKRDGNFINFDGRTIGGLTFHHQFDEPRGAEFPVERLFKTIDAELDHGRYVTIALRNGRSWGIYVIVGRTRSGDFHAVTRGLNDQTLTVTNVKARVREMQGTDILTYTNDAPKPRHE